MLNYNYKINSAMCFDLNVKQLLKWFLALYIKTSRLNWEEQIKRQFKESIKYYKSGSKKEMGRWENP